jgi:small-conductance mechanosensitive channel
VQEPFHIGDMVRVGEHFGRIEQIEARTTFMRLFDGQRVVVPNSDMTNQSVINFSTYPERRLTVEVGVAYDSDMSEVIRVILEALQKDNRILRDPPVMVTFSAFADSNMIVDVRFWIDNTISNWLEMTSTACQLIKQTFNEHGIHISFPIRTLSMNPLDSDDLYQLIQKDTRASMNMVETDQNRQN